MSNKEMLDIICREFPSIVRNEFHIQLKHEEKKYTDIWPMSGGGLKVKLYGQHNNVIWHSRAFNNLMAKLRSYDYKSDNDLARMRELERLMTKAKGKNGIYVDAGWKEGRARMAVLWVWNDDFAVHVSNGEQPNSMTAELVAISLAHKYYPLAKDIFSDCQPAVKEYNETRNTDVAKWIGRDENREADRLSNLRE